MPVSFPKILYRLTKDYFANQSDVFPHVREAMICLHTDWQNLQTLVAQRKDHKILSEAAIKLTTTLLKFIHDLGEGIGRFDVDMTADDLIRGTELAKSPCCSVDSRFVGVAPTTSRMRWKLLCPSCGKEWSV